MPPEDENKVRKISQNRELFEFHVVLFLVLKMDDIKRQILVRQWDSIVRDLEVDHVLDQLYSLQVLDVANVDSIRSKVR